MCFSSILREKKTGYVPLLEGKAIKQTDNKAPTSLKLNVELTKVK